MKIKIVSVILSFICMPIYFLGYTRNRFLIGAVLNENMDMVFVTFQNRIILKQRLKKIRKQTYITSYATKIENLKIISALKDEKYVCVYTLDHVNSSYEFICILEEKKNYGNENIVYCGISHRFLGPISLRNNISKFYKTDKDIVQINKNNYKLTLFLRSMPIEEMEVLHG